VNDLAEITVRKQLLIARCALDRAAIASDIRGLERPIAVADRIFSVTRFFRAHPVLLAVAVAAAVALRRRGALGLAARALAAWRTWRTISAWAERFGLEIPPRSRRQQRGHAAS
jgi:YqjK-like protein